MGQFNCGAAHAAGATVNQNALTFLDVAVGDERAPRGQGCGRDTGGFIEAQVRWLRRHVVCCSDDILGQSTAGDDGDDVVTWLPVGYARPNGINGARNITARDVGKGDPIVPLHLAGTNLPVDGVDARGMDANANFAARWLGYRDFVELENFRSAVASHEQGAHSSGRRFGRE